MTVSFNAILASAINNHLTLELILASSKMQGDPEQIKKNLTSFLNGRKITVAGQVIFVPKSKLVQWTQHVIHLFKCISTDYRLQFQAATDRVYSLISDSQHLPTQNKKKYLNIKFIQNCYLHALEASKITEQNVIKSNPIVEQENIQSEIDRKAAVTAKITSKIKELTEQREQSEKEKQALQGLINLIKEQLRELKIKISNNPAISEDDLHRKKRLLDTYKSHTLQLTSTKEKLNEIRQLPMNVKTILLLQKEVEALQPQFITEFGQDSIRKVKSSKIGLNRIAKPFELFGVEDKISQLEGQLKEQKEIQERHQTLETELGLQEQNLQKLDIKMEALKTSLEIMRQHPSQYTTLELTSANQVPHLAITSKIATTVQTPAKEMATISPKQKMQNPMFLELQKRGLSHLAGVFHTIFNKYPNVIDSWTIREDNNFCLQLKEPIQLWIPSEENPGGVVIQIGVNEKKMMSGKFVDVTHPHSKLNDQIETVIQNALKDPANTVHKGLIRDRMTPKGMKFETGFYFCCHTNNRMMGITDKIQVSYLLEIGNEKLLFIAGMLKVTQGRIRDAQSYQHQLHVNGRPLLGNISPIDFIKKSSKSSN